MTAEREQGSLMPSREDVLIGRVTDGEATPADWAELESLARRDAAVWQRLAESQRAHARFEHAVEDEIAVCELVEAPDRRMLARGAFVSRLREYSGWLAAAAVGLAWIGVHGLPGGAAPAARPSAPIASSGVPSAQAAALGSAPGARYVSMPVDQAYEQYKLAGLASGRVVTELPMVFLDTRPAQDGQGQDVIYVRRVVERIRAADVNVMNFEVDEHGRPVRAEPRPLVHTAANPL